MDKRSISEFFPRKILRKTDLTVNKMCTKQSILKITQMLTEKLENITLAEWKNRLWIYKINTNIANWSGNNRKPEKSVYVMTELMNLVFYVHCVYPIDFSFKKKDHTSEWCVRIKFGKIKQS